jgi:hypothetical protein
MSNYEEGCYGDGSFGPDHCMIKCIEIALSEDYPIDKDDYLLFGRLCEYHNSDPLSREELTDDERLSLDGLENDCIEYLDYYRSDDDHYWGYENGDFGYWRVDE